ncbi:uncharacterized protein METZ01_LOCUS454728 [marine metagenome]|uniref:Uncharacterized protein n=1 Tax=marine metagenome TaxID=408172 RepID=A0A383A2D9_9ZZZZ
MRKKSKCSITSAHFFKANLHKQYSEGIVQFLELLLTTDIYLW